MSASQEAEFASYVAELFNRAAGLPVLVRLDESLSAYEEVISRDGDRPEPEVAALLARALLCTGLRLSTLGCAEQALVVYDEIVERFGAREDAGIAATVVRALVNKAVILKNLNRRIQAMAVYAEVLRRYGEIEGTDLHARVFLQLPDHGLSHSLSEALNPYRSGSSQRAGEKKSRAVRFLTRRALLLVAAMLLIIMLSGLAGLVPVG